MLIPLVRFGCLKKPRLNLVKWVFETSFGAGLKEFPRCKQIVAWKNSITFFRNPWLSGAGNLWTNQQ